MIPMTVDQCKQNFDSGQNGMTSLHKCVSSRTLKNNNKQQNVIII